jgi:ribosomal RNA-processing protein 8
MTVHSFDLISNNKIVIACDIRSVPLKSDSVDIVVFCLSLMGTNYLEFIAEANRILKIGGKLKIAEVQSRITQSDGDTGVQSFVDSLGALGFKVSKKWDGSNKVFILFEFIKDKNAVKQGEGGNEKKKGSDKTTKGNIVALKPCLYKKR